jgi:NADPH2:quinone reductase
MQNMRAVVVTTPGPAESLQISTVPDPAPGAGEVSIDVAYAGVGLVDVLFRSGAIELPTPFTLGIEVTGHVRELGPGVTGLTAGQPVAALLNDFGRGPRAGGYAEIAIADASMLAPVPAGADLAQLAAVLINGVTGWIALHDLARLDIADNVLVLGASGGLGSITSRLAALRPARRVIGVAGSPAKREAVAAECTDVVIASELTTAVNELTEGHGVDVVIDPVGGPLRTEAFGLLAPFGRHIVLGNASGEDPVISGDAAWHGTRQLSGLSLGGVAHLIPGKVAAALAAVTELLHRGSLREPPPAVRPFDQVIEVHRALENRSAPAKTVLAIHG